MADKFKGARSVGRSANVESALKQHGDSSAPVSFDVVDQSSPDALKKISHIKISQIVVTEQVRKDFDEDSEEFLNLKNSIKENGILLPLMVRSISKERRKEIGIKANDDCYELVAGERRLRAAKLLDLPLVPVVKFGMIDDAQKLVLQLTENIQRKDLNNWEKANAITDLLRRLLNWEKVSNAEMYTKLLSIRNKPDEADSSLMIKLSKTGVGVESLINYSRMVAYPNVILPFFEKNKNFPQKYIVQYYSQALQNPEEVLEIFKRIVKGEKVEVKKQPIKKAVKEKSPENIQVRVLSKVKNIKKIVGSFVDENESYQSDGTKVYYKDKEKVLGEIEEMKSMIAKLEDYIEGN